MSTINKKTVRSTRVTSTTMVSCTKRFRVVHSFLPARLEIAVEVEVKERQTDRAGQSDVHARHEVVIGPETKPARHLKGDEQPEKPQENRGFEPRQRLRPH